MSRNIRNNAPLNNNNLNTRPSSNNGSPIINRNPNSPIPINTNITNSRGFSLFGRSNRNSTTATNSNTPTLNRNNNPNPTTPVLNRSNPSINTNNNPTPTTPILNRSHPSINTNSNVNSPNINRNNPMIINNNNNTNSTTTNNKDDDKSKNEKNEIEINWQDIVDKQIVGSGYLDFGCIFDTNGKVLATKNININEEEAKQFVKDFKNDEKVLKLSNKKYNTMLNDKQLQYYHGREGNNGIFCLKTKNNYIVGHYCEYHHYDNPVAKKSQVVMETVAKTMREQNL